MRVLHLVNKTPIIQEVPDSYILCSISGEYRAKEEYTSNGVFQTRTNCTSTYLMPTKDMEALELEVQKIRLSKAYTELQRGLKKERELFHNSLSIDFLIQELQKIKDSNEDARIVVTQDGYYADGLCAHIHSPEKLGTFNDCTYYYIGHSSQNY